MTVVAQQESEHRDPLMERLGRRCHEIQVINGHDHILPRETVLESGDVLLHLFATSVLPRGVVASDPALGRRPFDPNKSWEIMSRYLPHVTNTSAYRSLTAALGLLYDHDRFPIEERDYHRLREKMEDSYRTEDWYYRALREKAGIDVVVWNNPTPNSALEPDPELFLPAPNMDEFICAYRQDRRQRLEQSYHVKLQEFEDFIGLVDIAFSDFSERGVPAVWLSYCGFRPLRIGTPGQREAAAIFRKPESAISPVEATTFEDFAVHKIAEKCAALELPLQVDTGSPAEPLFIEQADPSQLALLIAARPATRFVCLHAGYPFSRALGCVAKTFSNVYMDASSLSNQSVSMMKEIIAEWVELVPVAKILLGAGNSLRIESTVGSVMMTRKVLAQILHEGVVRGLFTEELALDLIQKLLRDVARRFYRTDEIRIRRKTANQP